MILTRILDKTVISAIVHFLIYMILTYGLSISLYLTLGKYIIANYPSFLEIIDTFIYIVILVYVLFVLKRKISERIIISDKQSIYTIILITLGVTIGYRFIIELSSNLFEVFPTRHSIVNLIDQLDHTQLFIKAFNIIILISILEEMFFRKLLFSKLDVPVYSKIIITAILFAIAHISFYPFQFNILRFTIILLYGIILGVLFYKYGLLSSILSHIIYNMFWFLPFFGGYN